jgi:hypothetical protein
VSDAGLYTAPSTAGTHTVTATSQANSAVSAYATVTVGSGSGTPGTANVVTWHYDNGRTGPDSIPARPL